MGKHSAMAEKQSKTSKLAMSDSIYRANNESAERFRYGEKIKNNMRAYAASTKTVSYNDFDLCIALEKRLVASRYFVFRADNGGACVRYEHDSFCMRIEYIKKDPVYNCRFVYDKNGLPEVTHDLYRCVLTRYDCDGEYVRTRADLPDVIAYIEKVNRTYDRELFEYITR